MRRSIRSLGRGAAATALATSVVLGLGVSAASAQTDSVPDAHHDMWQTTDLGGSYTAAPKQVLGDLHGVTARYGSKNLVFVQHFANLAKRGLGGVYTVALRTNTGLKRYVQVKAARYHWGGTVELDSANSSSAGVACDGLAEHISYARNTVTMTVPAACLNNPRSVKFVAFDLYLKSKTVWYADNSSNAQAKPRGATGTVRRG